MEVDGYSAKSGCYGAFERRRETSTREERREIWEAWMSMWDVRREIKEEINWIYCPIVQMREDLKLERRMRMMLMNQNQSTWVERMEEKMEKNREDLKLASNQLMLQMCMMLHAMQTPGERLRAENAAKTIHAFMRSAIARKDYRERQEAKAQERAAAKARKRAKAAKARKRAKAAARRERMHFGSDLDGSTGAEAIFGGRCGACW